MIGVPIVHFPSDIIGGISLGIISGLSVIKGEKMDFYSRENKFINCLQTGTSILVLDCGIGRSAKYFKDKGHVVTAAEANQERCRIASDYTGLPVSNLRPEDIDYVNVFDGVWAADAFANIPYKDFSNIIKKISAALKCNGYMYISFRYGTCEEYAVDSSAAKLTEISFAAVLDNIPELTIVEEWKEYDNRPCSCDLWLNIILKKD